MDVDAYRDEAEQFIAESEREYYLHFSGIKETLEIEEVYERHAGLFTREAVDSVREEYDHATRGSELARQRRILLDFAVNGYVRAETAPLAAEQARREGELKLEIDGREVGYRQGAHALSNTADAGQRRVIHDQLIELMVTELNPVAGEIVERQHAAAAELGFRSYAAMCAEVKALDLSALHEATRRFIADSTDRYPAVMDTELQASLGHGLAEMSRADFSRFGRSADLDSSFPAAQLLPSLYETLAGLGIDMRAQSSVHLDVEARPSKTPRAFCAPVRTDEVYLVISPTGGREDFNALFHEAGHTQHFANMDPALPFEYRLLGDNAITEGFAFLFEHLEMNPRWLARRVGSAEPEAVLHRSIAQRALFVRRYCAKLAYELELHGDGTPGDLAGRYAELLGDGVGFPWPKEGYLVDVDPGFYCSFYLRAWALEISLRRELTERYGESWFEDPAAAELLRTWWSAGQRLSAEEFLHEISGETLDFSLLLADLTLA